MGKKVNPKIFRLNTATTHMSKWFVSKQQWPKYLQQDVMMRKWLRTDLKDAGVSRVEIRRATDQCNIVIATSKPGVIIGRNGSGIDRLRKELKRRFFGSEKVKINIEIEEVRRPDLDAELVMQNIIHQLEKRIPFRRAMKRAIESTRSAGSKGTKIICSGRLNGVEIARTETLSDGSSPSHTFRADIDYARGAAHTIYGSIGVKVWIYRGQVFEQPVEKPKSMRSSNTNSRSNRETNSVPAPKTSTATVKTMKKRTIVKAKPKMIPQ